MLIVCSSINSGQHYQFRYNCIVTNLGSILLNLDLNITNVDIGHLVLGNGTDIYDHLSLTLVTCCQVKYFCSCPISFTYHSEFVYYTNIETENYICNKIITFRRVVLEIVVSKGRILSNKYQLCYQIW